MRIEEIKAGLGPQSSRLITISLDPKYEEIIPDSLSPVL